jgi:hypothetical protein
MLHLADTDAFDLGQRIKKKKPALPVILLSHSALPILPAELSPVRFNPFRFTRGSLRRMLLRMRPG